MRSLSLYSKNPTTIIQRSQVWMHFKFCDIVWSLLSPIDHQKLIPDSNVGWANFGSTPGRQFRRWAHVGPTCISVWVHIICGRPMSHKYRYRYQHHYNDVIIGSMASFTQPFIQVADQRKHQSFASMAFVRGIHRWPVNSPHKWPATRKCFHLMLSSWQIHVYHIHVHMTKM